MESNNNPNLNCTIDLNHGCLECNLDSKISCKWNLKTLKLFFAIGIPPFLLTIFGFIMIGLMGFSWWWLIGYSAWAIVFFTIIEARFLCSHCPYYAAEGKTLKCLGNNGNYKFYKYHPEPINKLERFLMWFTIVLMIFFFIPMAGYAYAIYMIADNYANYGLIQLMMMIGLCFVNLATSFGFYLGLRNAFCSKCVNFSCGLNTVPKEIVDVYLRKNDVMRKAWEKAGYKLN